MQNPKVYGYEHLLYLLVFIIVGALMIILSKKYLKDEKKQMIYLRIIAFIILIIEILNRIGVASVNGWQYFLPYTFCGFSSLVISLAVLFGKPNMRLYQCFWYMALGGGIATMAYPDFIGQAPSIFYMNTITGLLHHSFDIILCIELLIFGWFKPSLKNWFYFPMIFTSYIVLGAFEISMLGINSAMSINVPVIGDGILNCWFIWIVASLLVFIISFLYDYIIKKRKVIKNEE